jgi:S-DNA-T family DNA segregation ATPase FtsK/SpoIIIE
MAERKKNAGKSANGKKPIEKPPKSEKTVGSRLRDEILAIIIIAIGIFLLVAFQTEAAGRIGSAIATVFFGIFGFMTYILPYYLVLYGILLFIKKAARVGGRSIIFFVLIYLMLVVLNASRFVDPENISYAVVEIFSASINLESGGVIGMYIANVLVTLIGRSGLFIVAFVVIVISLLIVVNTPISYFLDSMKEKRAEKRAKREKYANADNEDTQEEMDATQPGPIKKIFTRSTERRPMGFAGLLSKGQKQIMDYMKDDELFDEGEAEDDAVELQEETSEELSNNQYGVLGGSYDEGHDEQEEGESSAQFSVEDYVYKDPQDDPQGEPLGDPSKLSFDGSSTEYGVFKKELDDVEAIQDATKKQSSVPKKKYNLPSIELLNKGLESDSLSTTAGLKTKANKLEETLRNFNVDAKVLQVTQGPAVTRYEIQPNVGVKVNSIVRLADDIALNLEAGNIRIEAPIPGKAAVGIEVENEKIQMIALRDIVASREFKNSKSKITFAVGKDIAGSAIASDLKTMPHMLIAGATGSGKSVCINSIIISILYKASPDEVKFVLIDPKVVELGNYNGIPHLLIPVVTEPSKAAAALNWAVSEMTDRYKKFAEVGVRDLEAFNELMKSRNEKESVLPQIVIVIDELADLMMVAPSQVEESICRLAQMARAAGMHLIVATQRPSVDVITGVIKANIPSRIAFRVSSQFDSRTILDIGGAEKLVGRGDMLFKPTGIPKPIRVQGTFISDSEVHKVIEFVKSEASEVEYADDVIHTIERVGDVKDDDEDDLLAEAIVTVVMSKQASASGLQRRFRIGYNRAARMIEMMDARGIIGPADGSRPRQVLMTEEDLERLSQLADD